MSVTQNLAIQAALSQNWEDALSHNLAILLENPDDIDSLNRLTFAYIQLGEPKKARAACKRVLTLDPYNPIAIKNLQKTKLYQFASAKHELPGKIRAGSLSPSLFLEEPGKTKITSLVNVAAGNVLYTLSIGDEVVLIEKKHTVEVRDKKKTYLGGFPDDLGFKLCRFLKCGNQYKVYVKSVGKNSLAVFIRETKRCKRFKNQPSFPINSDHTSFAFHSPPPLPDDERFSTLVDLDDGSDE